MLAVFDVMDELVVAELVIVVERVTALSELVPMPVEEALLAVTVEMV